MAKRQKKDTPSVFDYRDVKTLQRYTNVYGQIESIAKTGLTEKQQRSLAVAIKRARHLALLPFVTHGISRRTKGCGAPTNSSKDEIKEQ